MDSLSSFSKQSHSKQTNQGGSKKRQSIKIHQVGNSFYYKCKVCRKSFKNFGTFQVHLNLHKVHRKNGQTDSALSSGIKNETLSNNIKRYFICRVCQTRHLGLEAYIHHQETHEVSHSSKVVESPFLTTSASAPTPATATTSGSATAAHAQSGFPFTPLVNTSEKEKSNGNIQQQNVGMSINENSAAYQNYQPIAQIPLNESTASLVSALYAALSGGQSSASQKTQEQDSSSKSQSPSESLQLEIPSHVKSIQLNNNTHAIGEVMKHIKLLHRKMDTLLKHLNLSIEVEENTNDTMNDNNEMHFQQQNNQQSEETSQNQQHATSTSEQEEAIILEGYPPAYSIVQAVKEQQQQEYYALTLSSRHAQQLLKTEPTQIINVSSSELKNLQKGKNVDLWVPSQHYLSEIAACTEVEQNVQTHTVTTPQTVQSNIPQSSIINQTAQVEEESPSTGNVLPNNEIEKIFVESRSRANFAKNLAFAIFSPDDRRGKNCTGRVFGKAQRKGQLDQTKLQIVKEITFRKYPCSPQLLDITWRKECITAIDSGLRNEHRSSRTILQTIPKAELDEQSSTSKESPQHSVDTSTQA